MDSTLQSRLHLWRQRNFPTSGAWHHLLGVVEEVGELSHAVLKRDQKIRGTDEEHTAAIEDAVGDITIYLMGFCSDEGLNFDAIVERTAEHVTRRDWITWPDSGFPPGDHPDDVVSDGTTVRTSIRNSPDQDPNYKRLSN